MRCALVLRFLCLCLVLMTGGLLLARADEPVTVAQAEAWYQRQQWAAAIAAYRQVLPTLEGTAAVTARLRLAHALQSHGDQAGALQEYAFILAAPAAEAAQQLDALKRIPHAYEKLGDVDKAVAAWVRLAEEKAAGDLLAADALIRAGDLLRREGKLDEAKAIYTRVLALKPGWLRLNKAQGRIEEVTALQQDDPAFWIDPYLLRISPTSARLCWASRGEKTPVGEVAMQVGEEVRRFQPQRQPVKREPDYYLHTVTLDGLQAGTRYRYTVRCGAAVREGSFKTAPIDAAAPVTVAVYGDTQDQPAFHAQVSRVMADAAPDIVLHTGDMVGDGAHWGLWKVEYFDRARPLLQQAPIWPTVGNHDGSYFFDPLFLDDGPPYYDVRYGNVHVFMLASYRSGGVGSAPRQAQLRWLEERLRASTAAWKLVVTHYPMLCSNAEHWTNWGRDDFLPLFEKYGVDIVFGGHIHLYRRFRPLGTPGMKPIFHINTSGGASVGGDIGKAGEGLPIEPTPLTVVGQKSLHYTLLRITGNRLEMEVRQRDGSVIDRLLLEKTDGTYQEEIMRDALPLARAVAVVGHYAALGDKERRRIVVDVTPPDRAGDPLEVAFSVPPLPEGMRMRVEAAPGSPWIITQVTHDARAGKVRLLATAPDKAIIAPRLFTPAFAIRYNLAADGEVYEPETFTLSPR